MIRRLLCVLLLAMFALPAAAAEYRVTFTSTWSAATHPTNFPAGAHYSWLVGGVHGADASFWDLDSLASPGLEILAEQGNTTPLFFEVRAAIDAGDALATINTAGLSTSPGTTTFDITVTEAFPRVTAVTMLAPSPDWFVGVSGLDLFAGGQWADSLSVVLYPLDSGTDDGGTYVTGNQESAPHQPVARILGFPFTPDVPIGVMSFVRTDGVTDVPALASAGLRAYPNPFNPRTTIEYTSPIAGRLLLTVHDLRGRLVRTLLDGDVPAGPGRVDWNGETAAGLRAPGGVYLLRGAGPGWTAGRRVVLTP